MWKVCICRMPLSFFWSLPLYLTLMFEGAMENWGLITYRETALLVDEANSSASSKQTVALVVGHEIAHMWFGNLVTMVAAFIGFS